MTQVRISMFGGFVLAFPVIAFQLWRFVAPGLYRREKRAFLPFLLASPILFVIGGAFAFYVVLPIAFDFFLSFQQFGGTGSPAAEADGLARRGGAHPVSRHHQRVSRADDEVHHRLRRLLPAAGAA